KRRDYLPFGEEILAGVGHRTIGNGYPGALAGNPRQHFTGKERDKETALDYFEARYFGSVYGRFTSPDEFTGGPTELFAEVAAHNPTFYADIASPQSLNKFAYCLNNPFKFVDPDGHQEVTSDKLMQSLISIDNKLRSAENEIKSIFRGMGKGLDNLRIGMKNDGNNVLRALGFEAEDEAFHRPSNETESIMMGTVYKEAVLAGFLGGRTSPGVMVAEGEGVAATSSVIRKARGSLTEPTLPPKTIIAQDGVKIVHYTASGDHGPAHLHVKGQGKMVRIGQNGKPLKNNPELSAAQKKVVNENIGTIRRSVDKIQRYHRFHEIIDH
ncbi:MAG: RHS repeat-associated core domain-containing protein, partial [Acidobacteria bacterium]|nr:RHS repeat-associated core domain-containing protein [Acidobacteriota bacterium]